MAVSGAICQNLIIQIHFCSVTLVRVHYVLGKLEYVIHFLIILALLFGVKRLLPILYWLVGLKLRLPVCLIGRQAHIKILTAQTMIVLLIKQRLFDVNG